MKNNENGKMKYNMIRNVLFTLMAVLFAVVMQAADNDKLPELRITVSKPIVKGMSYADGTMRLTDTDGSVVEMKAKFKTRGATAQKYMMKPSLNMKLRTDDYLESQDSMLLGMRSCSKWILDAMAIDRICMRNRICMDVWNAYSTLPYETDFDGRSGTVGKFVEMYINDSYYGIYCLSDHINRKLLQLKKYDEAKGLVRGVLYKSGTEDIADQNNRNFT
ncbi:MAG: CotH kinase family protein, partial [Prevotellaceae bacterium]|nr:CotH kinase family protein [Prevotellaceae bacterium]